MPFSPKRSWRWVLVAVAGVLWWRSGALLLEQPSHELAFATRTPIGGCTRAGCVHRYLLVLGNTGSDPLAEVRIRLRGAALARPASPPSVTNFGLTRHPFLDSREESDVRTIIVTDLAPRQRVQLDFALRATSADRALDWPDVLVDVVPSAGRAIPWDPALLQFGRVLTLFSSVL